MRILIVEDELLVRQRLVRLAGEIAGQRARFDAVGTLEDADEKLRTVAYDGLLLDLNLEGEDGFLLLRRATAGRYHTVVVSAHSDRALEAFALGVLDFVAKPFSRERLGLALERLLGVAQFRPGSTRWLAVWRAKSTALVAVDDVLYARAAGESSELVLHNGRTELHDKSLQRLADLLPADFFRCHRSYLVNLAAVRTFRAFTGSRYLLILQDGSELPVGRSQVARLRSLLGDATSKSK
jgi:two-component system, LytTR family, response regulator LytT